MGGTQAELSRGVQQLPARPAPQFWTSPTLPWAAASPRSSPNPA